MEVLPIRTRILVPPQDDLCVAIHDSGFVPREGDCVAVSSKVVSINEGRCVRIDPRNPAQRDELAKGEAEQYLERRHVPHELSLFTLSRNVLIGGTGIDASNADGHFILWPHDPMRSAHELLKWFKESYGVRDLVLVITDSRSLPLRRGAVGFALAWAGFDPLVDHRPEKDIFGRQFTVEHTNLADALATSAVVVMGETDACTPLAVLRDVPYLRQQTRALSRHDPPYEVPLDEDVFAPFLKNVPWTKGGAGTQQGGALVPPTVESFRG
jgi:F420-0:gamma-glutamyl ligase